MKKLILTSVALFALAVGMAQVNTSVVSVETDIQGSDTLRTFFIEGGLCDILTQKLTALHGTPDGENTGTMEWSNIDINGVGQNLDIHTTDGVMAWQSNAWTYITFNNATHKQNELYADPTRAQRMFITVKKGPNNKVNTAAEEAVMIQYLENLVLN